jgi:YegS/Rv2252/BmrU family lipid kinase
MAPEAERADLIGTNRKLLLIVNPVAGRKQALRLLADIVRIFMDAGYIVTVMVTRAAMEATALVAEYGAGYDAVVCVGGDGTLSETIAGALRCGADVPLGYIPAGSTNVFATTHGLSGDILTAAKNIAQGGVKRVDAGWFNARSFAFIAAFGAFSWSSYTTPQSLKNMLGSPAYILDGMMSLPKIKSIHIRVSAEETVHEGKYLFGAVCNLFTFPGLLKLPEGKVHTDDGLFEVILIKEPSSLLEWQSTINSVMSGKFESRAIEFFQAAELTIQSDEAIAWALDGEYEGSGSGETIYVRNQNSAFGLLAGKRE